MKERLLEYIEYKKLKNTDFEKRAGLSNGFVNNFGDNIREKTLQKISDAFPDLNIDWWKTGLGTMINNSQEIITQGNGNHNINGVNGNVTISHNEFSNMIELQKNYQDLQKELTDRLKTSQEQLSKSQNQLSESQQQITTLIEILKRN